MRINGQMFFKIKMFLLWPYLLYVFISETISIYIFFSFEKLEKKNEYRNLLSEIY